MNLPLWSWEKYEIWYGNSFNKDIDEAKAPNILLLNQTNIRIWFYEGFTTAGVIYKADSEYLMYNLVPRLWEEINVLIRCKKGNVWVE